MFKTACLALSRLHLWLTTTFTDTPSENRSVSSTKQARSRLYSRDLKGMVLVDSSHEQQALRVPGFAKAIKQVTGQLRILSLMNSFGLLALSSQQIPDRGLNGEALEQYRSVLRST